MRTNALSENKTEPGSNLNIWRVGEGGREGATGPLRVGQSSFRSGKKCLRRSPQGDTKLILDNIFIISHCF